MDSFSPATGKMDKAIVETIATARQPFTAVSDIGFQRLIGLAENLKDDKFYCTEMLDETCAEVVTRLKNVITPEEAPCLALSTGCWTLATEPLMSQT